MSGTVLDHWLVRGYLRELNAVMRGLPAAQARELKEQIAAHLDDALRTGCRRLRGGRDPEPAWLSRRPRRRGGGGRGGASGSSGPRSTLRGGWRLATVIGVLAVIAAVFGGQQISSDASNAVTFGRDQRLAQLNAAVVKLTQNLEDERDLSAGYVAHRGAGPVPVTLADARTATDAAARAVQADAAGVGAGYQPGTVQDLKTLLDQPHRTWGKSAPRCRPGLQASQVLQVYTANLIGPANTFSAAAGGGMNDARLQGTSPPWPRCSRRRTSMSVQRAVLSAALSARPPVLPPVT